VAFGSELLFGFGLWAVVGLIALGLGSAGVTVRRTQFRPVIAKPLRRQRRYGQILRAALSIYLSKPGLFLGIGVIFIPLGAVGAVLQELLAATSLIDAFQDLVKDTPFEAALVFGSGAIQFGTAYWLVIMAVVAALRDMDAGATATIASSYRGAANRFPSLLGARLRALAILALLSVTIIGIPVAVYLGVRWTFLEQAVLIEGAGAREARGVSADVVKGRWWRTLGVGYSVALIGIGLGPVIGMALVLLSSVALAYINVLSSLFYVALIPYVGIAMTLLYFDLQERRAGEAG
jgi:hypothetical protein